MFLGKVFERVMTEQLQGFLDDTSILDPFQSGFCPGHGTEMALVALTDEFQRLLDQGGLALLLFLDLIVMFSTVSYGLMTHCIADIGVQRTIFQWFSYFLHGQ